MRQVIQVVVALVWALWFGGTVALFVFVQALFAADRKLAADAAPQLFLAYGRYAVILAGVVLIGTFGWRVLRPTRIVSLLFVVLALAAAATFFFSLYLLPAINSLQLAGQGGGAQFRRLHGISMAVLSAATALLLLAGGLLPFAIIRADRTRFMGSRFKPRPSQPFEEPQAPEGLEEQK